VEFASTINHKPLGGSGLIAFIDVEDNPKLDRKKDKPIIIGTISPDYFKTLQIPLLKGRQYDDRDTAESPEVAIVNEAFVRRFSAGSDPIGKRVSFGCKEGLCRTIVGVVGNTKQENLTDDIIPELYAPSSQIPVNGMTLLVRTTGDPTGLVQSVRSEVFAIDKNQPVYDVKTLDARIAETMSVSRALMLLFASFAVLALVLASVGVYGVVSYSVNQRTHEIGIRIALGSRTTDLLKLTMKNGIALTLIGIAIGVGSAVMLTRFMEAMLFGVTPTDKLTFIGVSSILFLVALCASLIPARRATKVDPLVALRYE
jgi:putative ABC transport system permease protein